LIDHRSIDSSCKSTAPVDSMMAVLAVLLLALLLALPPCGTSAPLTVAVNVGGAIVATTDRRFLSFNIDMAEFTGVAAGPGGPPLDLSSALLTRRLNDLAQVGGSYLRIGGGSQACQTYNLTHDAPSAWWPVTSPYCMTHNATTGEWQAKSDMVTMHSGQFDTIAALLRRSPGVSLVLGLNQAYGRAMLPGVPCGAYPGGCAASCMAMPCGVGGMRNSSYKDANCPDCRPFDSSNVRHLLEYCAAHNVSIGALELGNEPRWFKWVSQR
jgi:hypothetical protein